ncbi:glycosyltransferase family 2 protein [Swingsia samuiensis]|uniref:Glycosyltransferase family 2 protein n=1 Tax=Swingsia samuiensis TaxID=1293412 RepID=A0A4Y6UL41_9PROT|nr:glycosyltransferase family 2 protein [Swingsia samuiensis]QDH17186.1 hypothetical protein E3D00_06110 [Swingsia samuiensis]
MQTHIVACARNEKENIVEWILYYKYIGVNKIWLYCNDDDPIPLYKAVYPFTQGPNPLVNFIHYIGEGEQKKMYKDYINNYMDRNIWVGFIDIDEFVTIREKLSINDVLAKFTQYDAVHVNWFNFGPGDNIFNSNGLVTKNLIHRNKFPNQHGKVFVKTSCIDEDWMNNDLGTFFHGFGANYKHKPFSDGIANIATTWGENFYDLFENDFQNYAVNNSDNILSTFYISHFQMRSFEHLVSRSKRKMAADFLDQNRWRNILFENTFWQVIEADNEVEDTFLRDNVPLEFSFETKVGG